MSHPGPLLADYVDGSLDPSTRAEVDAHLRGCATCRAEVDLATAGAQRARTLADPTAPVGIADAATAEVERLAAGRNPEVTPITGRGGRRRPTTPRVLAATGAAAAVLLLVVLVAPKLGQDNGSSISQAAAGAAAYPTAAGVEVQHTDYSFEALPQLAAEYRGALTSGAGGFDAEAGAAAPVAAPTNVPSLPTGSPANFDTNPDQLRAAAACLDRAFHGPPGTLSRVLLARYRGEPAYLGVYLIGPGAELPPTLLQVNVASVHGCDPVGQTSARL